MKKKFKKTLRSNTHPIKPNMVIKSKKDKLNTRRAKKIDMRKMLDKLGTIILYLSVISITDICYI